MEAEYVGDEELEEGEVEEEDDVIFKPNPGPQTTFLSAPEQEVLYGGAAGGGKSFAMLADPLRDLGNKHFNGILVRRTNDELRELIAKSKLLYPDAIKGAKFAESTKTWTSPQGGTLWLSYLERDDDVLRYQGQAFNWIGFDELTQWPTSYAWDYMRSRLRSANGLPLYQRATSNPGGPGHNWVKNMFINAAPSGKAFWAKDPETGKTLAFPEGHRRAGEPLFKRRFIPATLFDNPYLVNDDNYEANLLSLPEHQRKQLLDGNWDVAEGAAFPEFKRELHVVEPFTIPKDWLKFRAADYGYSSPSAILWFAVHPRSGVIFVYRELYVKGVLADDLADMVLAEERGEGIQYGILDSSLWHQRGNPGPSLAERMIKRGCRWRPSDRSKGSRIAGKNEIHRRLQVDEIAGTPRILFFDNCLNLIAQLPSIPLDKRNPEDVDTNSEDHIYDALRYGLQSRPKAFSKSKIPQTRKPPADAVFGY